MTAQIVAGMAIALGSAHAEESSAVDTVDALNALFGKHAGARASHAKGFCAKGDFTPSPQARSISKAGLLAAKSVPATMRFSIGGGNPGAPDKSKSVRGMAIRLGEGNELYDLVLISEPVFFASTPASFVSFLQARMPDPASKKPDPAKIEAHNQHYPEGRLQPSLVAGHAAPFSYATTPYFSNHAFRFVAGNGHATWARVELRPVAGTRYLTAEEEKSLPDVLLEDEFKSRLGHAPVEFEILLQPNGAHDSLTDSAALWNSDKPKLSLGKLTVHQLSGSACDQEVFVPTNLPHGIEASDDPILKIRAAAYAVSNGRRSHTN